MYAKSAVSVLSTSWYLPDACCKLQSAPASAAFQLQQRYNHNRLLQADAFDDDEDERAGREMAQ